MNAKQKIWRDLPLFQLFLRNRFIDPSSILVPKNHTYINDHKQNTIRQAGQPSISNAIIIIFTIIICFQEHLS